MNIKNQVTVNQPWQPGDWTKVFKNRIRCHLPPRHTVQWKKNKITIRKRKKGQYTRGTGCWTGWQEHVAQLSALHTNDVRYHGRKYGNVYPAYPTSVSNGANKRRSKRLQS